MKAIQHISLAAALAAALTPGIASAHLHCPIRSSVFGTVVGMRGQQLTIHTIESNMGYLHVETSGARINSNGLTLHRGVFVGAYGCLTARDRAFNAEDLTLATNANTYSGYQRRVQTVQGRIDAVRPGRVLIDSNGGHGNLWVYTNRSGLETGELVRATGSFDPMNAAFVASTITVTAR